MGEDKFLTKLVELKAATIGRRKKGKSRVQGKKGRLSFKIRETNKARAFLQERGRAACGSNRTGNRTTRRVVVSEKGEKGKNAQHRGEARQERDKAVFLL